jgi:hypothetical protein
MLTKEQALEMLKTAPRSRDKKSRVNSSFSQAQVVALVKAAVDKLEPGQSLDNLTERRVYQAARNQLRPRY